MATDGEGPENVDALLASVPALADRPDLVEIARGAFRFAQFLLDDEDNLTRTGNLTGAAKERLRLRTLELLGVETESVEAESVEADARAGEGGAAASGEDPA